MYYRGPKDGHTTVQTLILGGLPAHAMLLEVRETPEEIDAMLELPKGIPAWQGALV